MDLGRSKRGRSQQWKNDWEVSQVRLILIVFTSTFIGTNSKNIEIMENFGDKIYVAGGNRKSQ